MTETPSGAPPDCSVDAFLGGLVTLVQPRRGHRAGLDAALLQALVPTTTAGTVVDLGAGVGTVGFCVAARSAALNAIGIERDPQLVACGLEALGLPANAAFAGRVKLLGADVTASRPAREGLGVRDGAADWVLMNPPYYLPGTVRGAEAGFKTSAHVAAPGGLAAWCRAAAGIARPGGHVGIIHRAAALPEILRALSGRFGDIRVLPVHPSVTEPASRILVRARRGSRAGVQILPGLALHDDGGAWTGVAEAVLRGRAELAL